MSPIILNFTMLFHILFTYYSYSLVLLQYNHNSFLPSVNQTLGMYIFLIVLKIEAEREIYDGEIQT